MRGVQPTIIIKGSYQNGNFITKETIWSWNGNRMSSEGWSLAGSQNNNKINSGLGAFQFGWGTKQIMMQGAVSLSRNVSMAQAGRSTISQIRAVGSAGASYMKFAKGVNVGGTILGAGATVLDGFNNGFEKNHFADIGIQAVIYGVSASVPVLGWVVGGAYFLGDLYFQSTHDGKSITEYYLDKK